MRVSTCRGSTNTPTGSPIWRGRPPWDGATSTIAQVLCSTTRTRCGRAWQRWRRGTSNRRGERLPRFAFAYTGQASQWPGMGAALYASEPVFRAVLDRCDALLAEDRGGASLLDVMFSRPGAAGDLDDPQWKQPAIYALECALAALWESVGIRPDVLLGHSLGGNRGRAHRRCLQPGGGAALRSGPREPDRGAPRQGRDGGGLRAARPRGGGSGGAKRGGPRVRA